MLFTGQMVVGSLSLVGFRLLKIWSGSCRNAGDKLYAVRSIELCLLENLTLENLMLEAHHVATLPKLVPEASLNIRRDL